MSNKARESLLQDYLVLTGKYKELLPENNFDVVMIQIGVKMLMDLSSRHGMALEAIKRATEEGIKWHVEERALQNKGPNHV